MPDINFDQLSDRFKKNIYNTSKGQIRLEVLWRDISEFVPGVDAHKPLTVLDAGCGMAQISARLAQKGHHLTLNDISSSMLDMACDAFAQLDVSHRYDVKHQSLQSLADHSVFDLVLNHAVLEWTDDPKAVLSCLAKMLNPGGYLSLMFFNIHGLVYRNLVRGNLYKVERGDWAGNGKDSLTPINPLDPEDVFQWLDEMGLEVVNISGVRVFQDYLLRDIRNQISDEDIIRKEIELSRREPYKRLGRYIHVLCKKG